MPAPALSPSDQRRAIARRVADAHRPLFGDALLALVSGSVVEDLADARSDVDMAIVFPDLPAEEALRGACGAPWIWQAGAPAEGSLVVAFKIDGIEVQIAYSDDATLARELDQVLVAHDPDTPLHKLAEGLLKAEPLAGAERLHALQARIADFPAPLAEAMAAHFLGRVATPWRAIAQIVHRDAALWCRELQVQLGYRLVGALAGLNGLYFTTFQFKRMERFVARMAVAPADFAARIEHALAADVASGFAELHAL
ncbi:MAG TPA: hypothetical protein PL196_09445, partial [Burkholderiaceae bacterium]|nr:hypothetical protein [Burkholderiaceae bacterium]